MELENVTLNEAVFNCMLEDSSRMGHWPASILSLDKVQSPIPLVRGLYSFKFGLLLFMNFK